MSAGARLTDLAVIGGMLLGAAVAALGVGVSSEEAAFNLSDGGFVAVVGDVQISEEDFARAVRAVEADHRGPLSPTERQRILDRLVDEELLVQWAIEMDLHAHDPRVRADLSGAAIRLLVEQAERAALSPDAETLRAFYQRYPDRFRRPPQVRVQHLYLAVPSLDDDAAVRARAEVVRGHLVGDTEAVWDPDRWSAQTLAVPVPDGFLPLTSLSQYLGPTVVEWATFASVGDISPPIRSFGGYHIVAIRQRVGGDLPGFEAVQEQVISAYRREAAEIGLRQFLLERREVVSVVLAETL